MAVWPILQYGSHIFSGIYAKCVYSVPRQIFNARQFTCGTHIHAPYIYVKCVAYMYNLEGIFGNQIRIQLICNSINYCLIQWMINQESITEFVFT